ncbi:MAG TPA: molybdate ABC transporter permease subunit [Acidobacteriota bacterium]|nr:molybdate ABC transporter permease subunit [Acidobacteriota bacterium]
MLNAAEWAPVFLSFQVAFIATLFIIPPAIAVAWLLSRPRLRGRLLIETLVTAPLVLPPIITGYLLLLLLGRGGLVGGWLHSTLGFDIAFTWIGAAVAAGVLAFPLVVRAVQLSFESVDRRLEGASRTLGASPWDTFFSVTLPLAAPGILAGSLLGFARCLGEFGATIVLAGNIPGQTQTIPLAVYSAINTPGGEQKAMFLLVISIALSIGALVISQLLTRKKRRART